MSLPTDTYQCICGLFLPAVMKQDYVMDTDGQVYCQKCWKAKQRVAKSMAILKGVKK